MKKISDAELEVMKVIWNKKETTSLEIIKKLEYCNWNNNTIRTLLNRLIAKKAVGISKKQQKTYYYVPLIEENEYKKARIKEFIEKFFNNSIEDFLTCLIECDKNYYCEIYDFLKSINDS